MIVIPMPPASTTAMELTPVNVTTLLLAMEHIVKVYIYMWIIILAGFILFIVCHFKHPSDVHTV